MAPHAGWRPGRRTTKQRRAGSAALVKRSAWIGLGTALLLWPAIVNRYPIVFSDTAALEAMGLEPTIGWDKPWVYGPLTLLLHAGWSLWGVAVAQALVVSAVLWQAGRQLGLRGGAWHGAICAVLAVGSAAPWFACFVMPDVFAPVTVLSLFVLATGDGRWGGSKGAALLLATVAIASHLTHLVIAAACLPVILLVRPRRVLLCAAPLAGALAWLVACNAVGNGVVGVSPYGSVFALARLQADGPATDYLRTVCPQAGLRLCHWVDRLPMDSDVFLWDPDGPVWAGHFGPTLFAPEAAAAVRATVAFEPVQVARAALLNTLRQLGRNRLGDTLTPIYLRVTVGLLLRTYFPAAEQTRFAGSLQLAGGLAAVASPLAGLQTVLLLFGAAGSVAAAGLAWRRSPDLAALSLLVLAGVGANAFATGALSGPHDRYGARIAWLLLLPPLYGLALTAMRRHEHSAGLTCKNHAARRIHLRFRLDSTCWRVRYASNPSRRMAGDRAAWSVCTPEAGSLKTISVLSFLLLRLPPAGARAARHRVRSGGCSEALPCPP